MLYLGRAAPCRYKVTHTLDEVFEADPVVKHVLCDEAGVNNAYVGAQCVRFPFSTLEAQNH